jgi:hypothetical protein
MFRKEETGPFGRRRTWPFRILRCHVPRRPDCDGSWGSHVQLHPLALNWRCIPLGRRPLVGTAGPLSEAKDLCQTGLVEDVVPVDAAEAVDLLTLLSGEKYLLTRRMSGGETGAHEVVHVASETPLIMKWDTSEDSQTLRTEAVALTERLRTDAGWPVPRQQTVDGDNCLFVLQELMSGEPIQALTHPIVDEILDLHERRIGLARQEDPSNWPTALIETLVVGGHSYCLHDSLRQYDQRTAQLVSTIEDFGASLQSEDLTGGDIVHWDIHPGNLLQKEGSLSAVVDTDSAVVGDARFDLVSLAIASLALPCESGVRDRLFGVGFDGLDEVPLRAYLGHLFIRLLDWPIRRNRPDEIEFWLAPADKLQASGHL